MLALRTHDGNTVSVISPNELVSVSVSDNPKYKLLVETIGDLLFLCDWISPADEEPLEV